MLNHKGFDDMPTSSKGGTYRIVRLYKEGDKPYKTIKRGVSLTEAEAHCTDSAKRGSPWIDAFYRENIGAFI